MNIRITSLVYRCRYGINTIPDCPYLDYMAGGEDMRKNVCDKFEPCGDSPCICGHLEPIEKTEVKQLKTLELVKDSQDGYVRIGRLVYQLKDVVLLQVDYGDGLVTEWKDDRIFADRISTMTGKKIKASPLSSLLDFKSAVRG